MGGQVTTSHLPKNTSYHLTGTGTGMDDSFLGAFHTFIRAAQHELLSIDNQLQSFITFALLSTMSSSQEILPQLKTPLTIEEGVQVTGVLIDPQLSRVVDVSAQDLVDKTVRTLAGSLSACNVPFPDTISPEDIILQVFISELALLSICSSIP